MNRNKIQEIEHTPDCTDIIFLAFCKISMKIFALKRVIFCQIQIHMSYSGAVVLLYVPAVCGVNLYYTKRIRMIVLICHPVFVCHIPQSDSDVFGSISLSTLVSVQFNSIEAHLFERHLFRVPVYD